MGFAKIQLVVENRKGAKLDILLVCTIRLRRKEQIGRTSTNVVRVVAITIKQLSNPLRFIQTESLLLERILLDKNEFAGLIQHRVEE